METKEEVIVMRRQSLVSFISCRVLSCYSDNQPRQCNDCEDSAPSAAPCSHALGSSSPEWRGGEATTGGEAAAIGFLPGGWFRRVQGQSGLRRAGATLWVATLLLQAAGVSVLISKQDGISLW
jgi:hypothetical protein